MLFYKKSHFTFREAKSLSLKSLVGYIYDRGMHTGSVYIYGSALKTARLVKKSIQAKF